MNKITETDFSNLLIHGFHPKETLKNVKSLANNHPKFREACVILVKNFLDSVEEAVKDLKNKNCEEIHKKICKIKPAVSKMPDEIKSFFRLLDRLCSKYNKRTKYEKRVRKSSSVY